MMTRFRKPKIEKRALRTCGSALIVALVYQYLLGGRNPCFACIGAVYGMGNSFKDGFQNGFNRYVGTLFGGLLVIPFYWLYTHTPLGIPAAVYMILGLFCVILLNISFGAYTAIQPAAVVYFVVMFTQPATGFISYTIARIIDTFVGVTVSLAITCFFPTKFDKEEGISISESFKNWIHKAEGNPANRD